MSRNNQVKIGSVLSYLQMGLNIIVGLVYTPIMIRILGQSEYGLYHTVASTISMLSVLSLGFNSSYIRYYARYKKDDNAQKIYTLNGLFLSIFLFIGLIALLCGLYLTLHLSYIFDNGLTEHEYEIARILMLLLTINLSISFPMSVFSCIISANEKFIFLKTVGMIKTVLGPFITLPLLLMGFRSITMVSITVLLNLAVDSCYVIYVLKVLKYKFYFSGFEKGIVKDLFVYTSFIAINIVVDQINWNIDKILLGRFKGTISVAIYSVGFTLHHYYTLFSTSISGVFTPRVHHIVNRYSEDPELCNKELTKLFTKVGRIQFLIMSLLSTGLVLFGKPFILLWAGKGYEDSYYVTLLLVLPATIALIQNIGIEIQRAKNMHRFRSIVYCIMALCNLIISIYLCQLFGAVGSAVGTAISLILANGIIMNIYYHKKIGIDIPLFWKQIVKMTPGILFPLVFGFFILQYIKIDSFLLFFVITLLYSLVFILSTWYLSMNDYEKKLILSFVNKIMRRNSYV